MTDTKHTPGLRVHVPGTEYSMKTPRPDLGWGWRVMADHEDDSEVLSEHDNEEDARREYDEWCRAAGIEVFP